MRIRNTNYSQDNNFSNGHDELRAARAHETGRTFGYMDELLRKESHVGSSEVFGDNEGSLDDSLDNDSLDNDNGVKTFNTARYRASFLSHPSNRFRKSPMRLPSFTDDENFRRNPNLSRVVLFYDVATNEDFDGGRAGTKFFEAYGVEFPDGTEYDPIIDDILDWFGNNVFPSCTVGTIDVSLDECHNLPFSDYVLKALYSLATKYGTAIRVSTALDRVNSALDGRPEGGLGAVSDEYFHAHPDHLYEPEEVRHVARHNDLKEERPVPAGALVVTVADMENRPVAEDSEFLVSWGVSWGTGDFTLEEISSSFVNMVHSINNHYNPPRIVFDFKEVGSQEVASSVRDALAKVVVDSFTSADGGAIPQLRFENFEKWNTPLARACKSNYDTSQGLMSTKGRITHQPSVDTVGGHTAPENKKSTLFVEGEDSSATPGEMLLTFTSNEKNKGGSRIRLVWDSAETPNTIAQHVVEFIEKKLHTLHYSGVTVDFSRVNSFASAQVIDREINEMCARDEDGGDYLKLANFTILYEGFVQEGFAQEEMEEEAQEETSEFIEDFIAANENEAERLKNTDFVSIGYRELDEGDEHSSYLYIYLCPEDDEEVDDFINRVEDKIFEIVQNGHTQLRVGYEFIVRAETAYRIDRMIRDFVDSNPTLGVVVNYDNFGSFTPFGYVTRFGDDYDFKTGETLSAPQHKEYFKEGEESHYGRNSRDNDPSRSEGKEESHDTDEESQDFSSNKEKVKRVVETADTILNDILFGNCETPLPSESRQPNNTDNPKTTVNTAGTGRTVGTVGTVPVDTGKFVANKKRDSQPQGAKGQESEEETDVWETYPLFPLSGLTARRASENTSAQGDGELFEGGKNEATESTSADRAGVSRDTTPKELAEALKSNPSFVKASRDVVFFGEVVNLLADNIASIAKFEDMSDPQVSREFADAVESIRRARQKYEDTKNIIALIVASRLA